MEHDKVINDLKSKDPAVVGKTKELVNGMNLSERTSFIDYIKQTIGLQEFAKLISNNDPKRKIDVSKVALPRSIRRVVPTPVRAIHGFKKLLIDQGLEIKSGGCSNHVNYPSITKGNETFCLRCMGLLYKTWCRENGMSEERIEP